MSAGRWRTVSAAVLATSGCPCSTVAKISAERDARLSLSPGFTTARGIQLAPLLIQLSSWKLDYECAHRRRCRDMRAPGRRAVVSAMKNLKASRRAGVPSHM